MINKAVLFDLDGTLVDTAPDMIGAINQLRQEQSLTPLPNDQLRPWVSKGSPGLINQSFNIGTDDDDYPDLRDRFLSLYQDRIAQQSAIFKDLAACLEFLEERGYIWGIVTNKPGFLTEQLVAKLKLNSRAAVVTSGDTYSEKKPHPLPLIESLKLINTRAKDAIYVGDDERDIQAGRAAGMTTVAAGWGYIPIGQSVAQWNADYTIQSADQLTPLIDRLFSAL